MKKRYMNPNMIVVNLKMQQRLLSGSDRSFGLTSAGAADSDTKNGGWNARQFGGFIDDDEE